jgi:hypothetical protein
MTLEYVLLLIIGGVTFMGALMKAPKTAFEKGGIRLASRVETQLATGSGFQPYGANGNSNDGAIPWQRQE